MSVSAFLPSLTVWATVWLGPDKSLMSAWPPSCLACSLAVYRVLTHREGLVGYQNFLFSQPDDKEASIVAKKKKKSKDNIIKDCRFFKCEQLIWDSVSCHFARVSNLNSKAVTWGPSLTSQDLMTKWNNIFLNPALDLDFSKHLCDFSSLYILALILPLLVYPRKLPQNTNFSSQRMQNTYHYQN